MAVRSVGVSGSQSMQVFRIFGYGLLAGVVFLVPAFPATSIVNEKNNRTLTLLLNSPLMPFRFTLARCRACCCSACWCCYAACPASAACYAMGGISASGELGMLYFVLVLLILQYTTLGMLVSSYAQTE